MGSREYSHSYLQNGLPFPPVVPRLASLAQYGSLLFNAPGFLLAFWRSLLIALSICCLQLLFCIPCAYGLSKLRFRGRNAILFLCVVVTLMPFQVTMLPMYQIVRTLGLLDRSLALIVPEIFAPFTVFILTQFIHHLPDECVESVRLETSSAVVIYRSLVLPIVRSGITSAVILSFVETWNMVEKPLRYLSDVRIFPLSMLLHEAGKQLSSTTMAGSVLYDLPVRLLWWLFQEDLANGMSALRIK